MTTLAQLRSEFGDVEDYYPEEEIDDDRRAAWKDSRDSWAAEIRDAEKAAARRDVLGALDFLATASEVEGEWGDDPATRGHTKRILSEIGAIVLDVGTVSRVLDRMRVPVRDFWLEAAGGDMVPMTLATVLEIAKTIPGAE